MEGYSAVILETLFPTRCVSCEAFGSWCCPTCREKIEIPHQDPASEGLEGLVVAGFYHDPILRALIHGIKYEGATEFTNEFRHILKRFHVARSRSFPWTAESSLAIQPVIAVNARVRARGFDQSILIADIVRECLAPNATSLSVLTRTPPQSVQADLEHGPLRSANVHKTFHVREDVVVPSAILLVDDVYTTGSTMRDAARALREQGAERIYGFALAIGA